MPDWWRLQRIARRLTWAQVLITAGTACGFLASVMLMIAAGVPVFCREMGALFLVGIALYLGVYIAQFVRIFFLLRQAESQQRIIDNQGKSIESLRSIINKRRGDAGWLS